MSFTHLAQVLEEAGQLGRLFASEGHRLFLVGGVVRDQWLDLPLDAASDIDLTTDARPADIKRIVSAHADDLWTQGERFGTIGMRVAGRDYEITTHRAESYSNDSRKPQVSFGDDIEIDLSRRDFTVNAMAIELPSGELVDPFGGAADLVAHRLRTPLSADVSFTDDPLRMLRAARFATKYELVPDGELVASAARLHDRLRIVAIERIGIELKRLLELEDVRVGLRFLAETGLLVEVLGYRDDALTTRITTRIDQAVDAAAALPPRWHQRLATLGIVVFGGGDAGVRAMCRRLRLSRDDERSVVNIAAGAQAVVDASDTLPSTLRRWIADCDDCDTSIEVARAVAPDPSRVHAFERAVHELRASESTDDMTLLDGQAIMSLLGIESGPAVGRAQALLREHYFATGPMSESTQLELLRAWRQLD